MLFERQRPRRAIESAPNTPSPAHNTEKKAGEPLKKGKKPVLHWLNSAKGIGVILVIFGHLLYKSGFKEVNHFIYAFHMPMFFLISGFVQKPVLKRHYLLGKVQRLLLPFLCWSLLSLPQFAPGLLKDGYGWKDIAADALYLNAQVSNNPLWFLITLFETYCLFALFHWVLGHWAGQLVLCAGAFGAGYWLYLHKDIEALNTFGINRGVICFGFFLVGMLLRHLHTEKVHFWHWLLCPALLAGGVYVGVVLNEKISFYNFKLRIYPYFLLAAVLISLGVLLLCRVLLDRPGPLEYLSRYSILFLGSQYLWTEPFKEVMGAHHLTRTTTYEVLMVALAAAYLVLLPRVYDLLKKSLPPVKLLNGEPL